MNVNDFYEVMTLFAGAAFFIMMALLAFFVALYVLKAIGISALATSRGLPTPWLIWVPVVGVYTLGAIADDIGEQAGRTTYFRYLLLGGEIANFFLDDIRRAAMAHMRAGFIGRGPRWGGTASIIYVAVFVITMMALYHIFKHYRPESATLWTVLCIVPFITFMQNIFLYIMRNDTPPTSEKENAVQDGFPPVQ